MIEIEKKFQPTYEQLKALLEGAEFVEDKSIRDIYYDTPTFDYFKSEAKIKLRKRDGSYELKIQIGTDTNEKAKHAIEITNEKEILEKLGFDTDSYLETEVKKNLEELVSFTTHRTKYKKEGFLIDIDEIETGLKACEIELLVNDESEIKAAEDKIIAFANQYGLSMAKLPTKTGETLRVNRPEVYEQLIEYL